MLFFSTAFALAAIPAAVLAATQTVTVGDGGMLAFNPSNIQAAVGDQVNFEFRAKNHSVTQSTFASPCTKAMFNGSTGINSGFLFLSPNQTFANGSFPTWSITVNATTPLWFYCAQKVPVSHCEMGMVFSINATPEKSFTTFQSAAMASNSTASPGAGATPTNSSASGDANSGSPAAAAGGASGTQAASSESTSTKPNPNGASKVVFTRGAAGLLTIVAIGATLL